MNTINLAVKKVQRLNRLHLEYFTLSEYAIHVEAEIAKLRRSETLGGLRSAKTMIRILSKTKCKISYTRKQIKSITF